MSSDKHFSILDFDVTHCAHITTISCFVNPGPNFKDTGKFFITFEKNDNNLSNSPSFFFSILNYSQKILVLTLISHDHVWSHHGWAKLSFCWNNRCFLSGHIIVTREELQWIQSPEHFLLLSLTEKMSWSAPSAFRICF